MEEIRISAKQIGELELEDFCPRCFWIKMHCKLPYQIFPGIFSSIDRYSKEITNKHFEQYHKIPKWFSESGIIGEPVKVKWNEFYIWDDERNILLRGIPDEILRTSDGSYFIIDYKTARFTGAQDKLFPIYDVQLNAYAYIAERIGFSPVSGLALLYYEPLTEISTESIDSFILDEGFSMHFQGKFLPVTLNPGKIPSLLDRVREIYDMPIPDGIEGCKNCQLLNDLLSTVL